MKHFLFFLLLLTGTLLSALEINGEKKQETAPSGTPEERFLRHTGEFLKTALQEEPALQERLAEPGQQEELLEKMIPLFLPDAVSEETYQKYLRNIAERKELPPVLLCEKQKGYIVIRLWSVQKFPKGTQESLAGKNGPVRGVILDLRHCSRDFPVAETEKLVRDLREGLFPVAVLVSRETVGGAEQMAAYLLSCRKKCAVMGEPTAGYPYPMRKTVLLGKEYRLPVKTNFCGRQAAAKPVIPSIQTKKKESEKTDSLLRQAGDFLTAWHALNKGN